ncbi:MAG: TetR/AcrR family transcriptional regulator [Rhodothermales bacterium]
METDLRRILLDTARRLLVQEGYSRLSMRKIATEAGYSATSLYLHFANKDDLIHTLIEEGMERLYAGLAAARSTAEGPEACLRGLSEAYLNFAVNNAEYYEVMFMQRSDELARFPTEKYRKARRNLDLFRDAIAEGQHSGVFREGEPFVQATSLWALLHGTVALHLAGRVDARIHRTALFDAVVTLALAGVQSVRASEPTPSSS